MGYKIVIKYNDKELYLESFNNDNTFEITDDYYKSQSFSFTEIKNNFVKMKGKILESDENIIGLYIISECRSNIESEEYLNDYFSCYKWYYEAMYGAPYPENSKGVIFVDSADDVLNEYYQCLENISKELGLTIVDRNKNEELNDDKIKLFNIDEEDKQVENVVDKNKKIMSPREIKEKLDEYVIGQDEATKKMAIVAYNHMLMINNPEKNFSKQNILLIGSSGSGKTYMCEVLSKIIDVPVLVYNIATTTSSGYISDSVSDIFVRLYNMCDGDLDKAQNSLCVLDEFDKKVLRKTNPKNGDSDIAGSCVVDELLKILEGTDIEIEVPGMYGRKEKILFNTSKITFVLAGACRGILAILKEKELAKLNANARIGIGGRAKVLTNSEDRELRKTIDKEILKEYGFSEEVLGRVACIANLNTLTIEDLKNILKNRHGYLQEIKDKFMLLGKEIEFTDEFIESICKEALENESLGSRELNYLVNKNLEDIMFNIDEDKVKYTV